MSSVCLCSLIFLPSAKVNVKIYYLKFCLISNAFFLCDLWQPLIGPEMWVCWGCDVGVLSVASVNQDLGIGNLRLWLKGGCIWKTNAGLGNLVPPRICLCEISLISREPLPGGDEVCQALQCGELDDKAGQGHYDTQSLQDSSRRPETASLRECLMGDTTTPPHKHREPSRHQESQIIQARKTAQS